MRKNNEYKLTEAIIALSEANTWNLARDEWEFKNFYYSDDEQSCLCGHYPIRNISTIINNKNGNETEVGNCCIEKFLGIKDGNTILKSVERLKGKLSKSMSADALDYIYNKGIISDSSYNFYYDIRKKRKLSEKQLKWKKQINQKLLNYTNYKNKQ